MPDEGMDQCPRCGRNSVKIIAKKAGSPKDHPSKGDSTENHCIHGECGWRSSVRYDGKQWVWEVSSYHADKKRGVTKI